MAEGFSPEIAALAAALASGAALLIWRPEKITPAVAALVIAALGLLVGSLPGLPGSPFADATWGTPSLAAGLLFAAFAAALSRKDVSAFGKETRNAQTAREATRREVERLGGINVRLEDEVRDLRGQLTKKDKSDAGSTDNTAAQAREALVRLHANERRQEAVFQNASDGMAMLRQKTLALVEVNKALIELTGFDREQLLAMTITDLFASGKDQPGRLDLQRAAKDERSLTVNLVTASGGGRVVEVFCAVVPMGRELQLLVTFHDSSLLTTLQQESERAQEEVQARQREVEELSRALDLRCRQLEQAQAQARSAAPADAEALSALAHELRTPLTSIKSFSEILLSHREADESVRREFLEIIHKESDRLERMVSSVLDRARSDGGLGLDLSEFDARDVAVDAVDSLSRQAARRGIRVVRRWDGTSRRLLGDRDKIQQLVMNLLANAYKFTPEGGEVQVMVLEGPTAGRVQISVVDDGIGIPAADLSAIFDRNYQVAGTSTEGAGLGLAICQEIATLHCGRIWAESAPGEGSAFHVELPSITEARRLFGESAARKAAAHQPITAAILSPLEEQPVVANSSIFAPLERPAPMRDRGDDDGLMSDSGTLPPLAGF